MFMYRDGSEIYQSMALKSGVLTPEVSKQLV